MNKMKKILFLSVFISLALWSTNYFAAEKDLNEKNDGIESTTESKKQSESKLQMVGMEPLEAKTTDKEEVEAEPVVMGPQPRNIGAAQGTPIEQLAPYKNSDGDSMWQD